MQLFACVQGVSVVAEEALVQAVDETGRIFGLDASTVWSKTSRGGRLKIASMHHADDVARPRTYRARLDRKHVLFDGLPVDRRAEFKAYDAKQLLEHWEELPDRLEGQYCALLIDLDQEKVEILLDTMGMVRVFSTRVDGGWIVSNSAAVIRLITRQSALDPFAVSTYLTLGWCVESRTLIDGIRSLPGGCLYRLSNTGIQTIPRFTPAVVSQLLGEGTYSPSKVSAELTTLTRAAVTDIEPVECAITAGRDSRVNLALARKTAIDVGFYTIGNEGIPDVDFALDLARRFGLKHRVLVPNIRGADTDWTDLAARLILQGDGLANFASIGDYVDQDAVVGHLGVKFWGVGGEIGRAGAGDLVSLAATLPGLRRSTTAQSMLVSQKVRRYGLTTASAVEASKRYIAAFVRDRVAEGWPVASAGEAFYAFERVGGWAASGARTTSATHDLFTPFMSQSYLTYAFSMSPAERVVEAPHYRLLSALDIAARDAPYEYPWRPQNSRAASLLAGREVARTALKRVRARWLPKPRAERRAPVFYERWFDAHIDLIREMCLSIDDQALWQSVDRRRLEAALSAESEDRRSQIDCLLRVAAICWYVQGPRPRL